MILKKLGEEYKLYSHDSCIATTQESPHKRLSKQNCDEIFWGLYDTEIEVEIDMWFHGTRHEKGKWIERLDENGCLILKKL